MDQRNIGRNPAFPANPPFWRQPRGILIAAIVLFALLTAWLSAFNTQAGTVDIVLRWGAPIRVTEPGLNFKIPYVDSRHTVELRERAYSKTYELASRDPMELNVTVALNWAVNKEHVIQMYNQFGSLDQFEQRIIAPRLPDAVKAVVSRFAVNELLTKRNELRDQASAAAALAVIPQQIMTITGFSVTNVEFPKAYTQQIAAVQVAREAANAQEQELRKQNFKAQEVFNTRQGAGRCHQGAGRRRGLFDRHQGQGPARHPAAPGGDPQVQPAADRLGARGAPRARRAAADLRGRRRQRRAHVPARSEPARQQEVRPGVGRTINASATAQAPCT